MTEPLPVWADAPRLCPDVPLPAYRFVPGLNAHPTQDPQGHSVVKPPFESLTVRDVFLCGVDLYHQGYLWEAHEAWEHLWKMAGRRSAEGRLLQALIKNAAALLKAHVGSARGARRHSRDACALLEPALNATQSMQTTVAAGMDIEAFAVALRRCYEPLWATDGEDGLPLAGPFPRITMAPPCAAQDNRAHPQNA